MKSSCKQHMLIIASFIMAPASSHAPVGKHDLVHVQVTPFRIHLQVLKNCRCLESTISLIKE